MLNDLLYDMRKSKTGGFEIYVEHVLVINFFQLMTF